MRIFCSLCLLAALATPAWAAQDAPLPPPSAAKAHPPGLKPGRAAGMAQAQQIRSGIALVAAGGIVAVVALVAGTGGGNSSGQAERQTAPVSTTP